MFHTDPSTLNPLEPSRQGSRRVPLGFIRSQHLFKGLEVEFRASGQVFYTDHHGPCNPKPCRALPSSSRRVPLGFIRSQHLFKGLEVEFRASGQVFYTDPSTLNPVEPCRRVLEECRWASYGLNTSLRAWRWSSGLQDKCFTRTLQP